MESFRILDCRRTGWLQTAARWTQSGSRIIAILDCEDDVRLLARTLCSGAQRVERLNRLMFLGLLEVLKPAQVKRLLNLVEGRVVYLIDRSLTVADATVSWSGALGRGKLLLQPGA